MNIEQIIDSIFSGKTCRFRYKYDILDTEFIITYIINYYNSIWAKIDMLIREHNPISIIKEWDYARFLIDRQLQSSYKDTLEIK